MPYPKVFFWQAQQICDDAADVNVVDPEGFGEHAAPKDLSCELNTQHITKTFAVPIKKESLDYNAINKQLRQALRHVNDARLARSEHADATC